MMRRLAPCLALAALLSAAPAAAQDRPCETPPICTSLAHAAGAAGLYAMTAGLQGLAVWMAQPPPVGLYTGGYGAAMLVGVSAGSLVGAIAETVLSLRARRPRLALAPGFTAAGAWLALRWTF